MSSHTLSYSISYRWMMIWFPCDVLLGYLWPYFLSSLCYIYLTIFKLGWLVGPFISWVSPQSLNSNGWSAWTSQAIQARDVSQLREIFVWTYSIIVKGWYIWSTMWNDATYLVAQCPNLCHLVDIILDYALLRDEACTMQCGYCLKISSLNYDIML